MARVRAEADTATSPIITVTHAQAGTSPVSTVGSTVMAPGTARPPGFQMYTPPRPITSPFAYGRGRGLLRMSSLATLPPGMQAPFPSMAYNATPPPISSAYDFVSSQDHSPATPTPGSEITALLSVLLQEKKMESEERDKREQLLRQQLKEEKEEERRTRKEEKEEERRTRKEEKEEERRAHREEMEILRQALEAEKDRQLQREERAQEREHTLVTSITESVNRPSRRTPRPQLRMPELQPTDDIDDFLHHFDAVANNYQLDENEKNTAPYRVSH